MTSLHRSDEDNLLIALRHPLRRRILREMADGIVISPRELSTRLRQPLSNVSYHVRVLAERDVINLVETRPAKGSIEHFYRSTVMVPWARQLLGQGESDGDADGESSGAIPT
jgi:DNA-binding transcriptional ArsR family regulator